MNDKIWIKCFFLLAATISLSKCQCPTPTAVTNGAIVTIIHGKLVGHYCNVNYTFSTNDYVITSDCAGTSWTAVNAVCSASGPATTCPTSPTPPNNTTELTTFSSMSMTMKVYQCNNDLQWLSGEPLRISQCVNGSWTRILDICEIACPIPRHCADVAALSLSGTGDFYVVPSGQPYGQVFLVHCELDATPDNNGGNWTYIFKTDTSDFAKTMDQYLNGIGLSNYTSNAHYFIGLYFLSNVSLPLPPDYATGMTLEVLFNDSSNKLVAYATYDNFTVGNASTSYSITSLGKYHGNAGDALCPQLGTPFNFSTATTTTSAAFWWRSLFADISTLVAQYNGSFLTSKGTWKTLNPTITPSIIVMRIRPTLDEDDTLCPPMVGTEFWWESTNASIPYSRYPGTNITWQCNGDYIMEGVEGGNRTHQGISTCLNTTPPQWSYNVTLPCSLSCPVGFVESDDARVCFNYSTDTASSIMDAAMKCSAKGAYLSVIVIDTDFLPSNASTGYYTAFAARGRNDSQLVPPLPATVLDNCTSVCTPNKTNQCTVVQAPDQYKFVNCSESHNYLCQLQGYCPNSTYQPIGGRCLKVFSGATSLYAASSVCAAEGASLVYPTTIAEAANITSFLLKNASPTTGGSSANPNSYFIGTNNFNGDWTSGGMFVMGDLLTSLGTDPVNFWRTMTVYTNKTFSFTPIDVNAIISNTMAVCSLFGPLGCSGYCPTPAANMYIVNASGNATDLESTVSYKCYPGYFFNNITIDVVNSSCNGLLGGSTGWIPSAIPACVELEVCEDSTLNVQSSLLTNNSVAPDSYYLNATTTFTCPPNMGYITNTTTLNTTCQGNASAGYVYDPAVIPACDACLAEITVGNATTNWTSASGKFVTINQTVSATCFNGYEVAMRVTVQNITCTQTGWNLTDIESCFLVCVNSSPAVHQSDNVTAPNVTDNKIGTVITYNCTPGYSFLTSASYKNVTNQVAVTCDDTGNWVPARTPLQCDQLCTADPPPAPPGTTSNWDTIGRNVGSVVVYTASPGTLFGNYSSTWTIYCNGSVWLPIDNSSTSPTGNGQMLSVKRACMLAPPDTIGGALPFNWNSTLKAFTGQTLTYNCPAGHFTTTGLNSTILTCDNTTANWTTPPTTFLCKTACPGPPPPAPAKSTYNYTGDFTQGVVVTYNCTGGFVGGLGTSFNNNCTNGNWTVNPVPTCLTVTTPKPTTTPPYFFTTGHTYPETATKVFADIQNFELANSVTPGYTLVTSLVGFGYAVQLNASKSQCMAQSAYDSPSAACASNPKDCPNGFSISIWAQIYFNDSDLINFENPTDADNHYFLSTGADETGYPGVLIGVCKIWLFALVSTGDRIWKVRVLGPINNDTWNNVGVTWNQTGLTVFVNSTQVGSTTTSVPVTAKPSYSPPLLMVGCSKTPAESNYSGYCNGILDEVAIWNAPLNDSSKINFMGGYSSNLSDITPSDFASLVKTVLLDDPKQQAAAVSILQQMSQPDPSPTATASGAVSSTASTGLFSTAATLLPGPGSVTKLQTMAVITMSMLDVNKVPTNITPEQCDSFLNIANPISNLLDPANTGKWLQIYNQTENVGVMQTISSFTKWQSKLVQAIALGNISAPTCGESIYPYLYYKYCKMTIEDLAAMSNTNNMITMPDYSQTTGQQLRTKWRETLTDRVSFPTSIFGDDRCSNRPVTFIFNYFNTDSKSIATSVNPMYLDPTSLLEIDSKVMYINLVVDPPTDSTGAPDPTQPLCEFDSELLKQKTIMITATHVLHVTQLVKLRKLMGIFDNVSNSNIEQRFCVIWNENITDYGGWDSSGCEMVTTSAESSKCACSKFGIFSILAVETPPKIVPPVPAWLNASRYILYLISIVALSFYIVVVLLSGDLKEQFHLIGLNLAVAILVGSLAMLFSELNAITTNRDMCTLFGTLIHLFYGAVGAWMLVLGYSSFRAITSGVIGGMLGSYMLLCWGIAIAFVGIPFLWLLTEIGTDPRCFIGWPNQVKGVFFVLQMTYVIIAMFFAVVVFCNLSTPALRKDNLIEDYCSFCRGAALLIVYLSATWLFGMFTYIRFPFTQVNFYPLFQVLNSLSGVSLFIFIGLGSNRFRSVLTRKSQERREKLRNFAFGYQADESRPKIEFVKSGSKSSTLNLVPQATNGKED